MNIDFDKKLTEKIPVERHFLKKTTGEPLELLVCFPQTQPKACIIFIHGGGWKSDTCERLRIHAQYAAQCGAVAMSISYRLISEENSFDVRDGLEDCLAALTYARGLCEKKYGKLSFIAAGDSAGGYYAACLGCGAIVKKFGGIPVDFVVDWNGIVDLTGKWNYGIRIKDNDVHDKNELEREFSPLYNISASDAPVLIMHGTRDKTVALSDALTYSDSLRENGVQNDLVVLKDASHAFILFDYKHDNACVAKILQSVMEYLKKRGII